MKPHIQLTAARSIYHRRSIEHFLLDHDHFSFNQTSYIFLKEIQWTSDTRTRNGSLFHPICRSFRASSGEISTYVLNPIQALTVPSP